MKIIITGGPSSGKTAITDVLCKLLGHRVMVVPETASLLFRGGLSRFSDSESIKLQQMAIYRVQCLHEEIIERHSEQKALICDRGTLDGVAYWPEKSKTFFESVGTSYHEELSRYDSVIYLEPAFEEDYSSFGNPVRRESYKESLLVAEKTFKAWSSHSDFSVVSSHPDFVQKVNSVVEIVKSKITI